MEHKEKKFFPLFVDFTQKRAVVIGGGKIAVRRIQTLLTFVGEITVIAPVQRVSRLSARRGKLFISRKSLKQKILKMQTLYLQ